MGAIPEPGAEARRLAEDERRERNWKRWGPYLAERQWATVREDYSEEGHPWSAFTHDQARSRVYRWGEDGLLGITDRECRLCFALALWNGKDPILKERLFGLANGEGNHGEDVKERYHYLDATPTHSFLAALYRYPQAEFPYRRLVEENRARGRDEPEFELEDTGVFQGGRFFDVRVEYAKASPDDLLVRIAAANRGPEAAVLHLLPTLWFRNTWAWGRQGEGYGPRPRIAAERDGLVADHASLGRFRLAAGPGPGGERPAFLFTENETNARRLYGTRNAAAHVKDAFHAFLVEGRREAVSALPDGTKAGCHYRLDIPAGAERAVCLRLSQDSEAGGTPFDGFEAVLAARRAEADAFWAERLDRRLAEEERRVARQACAGLLWSKQFYHYVVRDWAEGDPSQPAPPPGHALRNLDWHHVHARDVLCVPDKWEYPWFAAWDLAFQAVALARVDPALAKEQLVLLLREWYLHPAGQLPAYEFAFSDVNPPVHAWAAWRVYKATGPRGARDRAFLERVFHKCLLNFTWWVNRKDPAGDHLFSGGFLGLDNIGVFDRSRPLPGGARLEQADGTAWMAFYCTTLLAMALELAREEPVYDDLASKFFEHFVAIADAMNGLGGTGLWDEEDGFYYDQILLDGRPIRIKVRSAVGLIPLLAVEVLEPELDDLAPGFTRRMRWFLANRPDLASRVSWMSERSGSTRRLLAVPTREQLVRVLRYLLDESEFLSPHGVRSLSRWYRDHPFVLDIDGGEHRVDYEPAESRSSLFGGNSNWRGPVWFPLNYLLVEALERWHHFFGDSLRIECPTGSGRLLDLREVAREIASRLTRLFLPGPDGKRPCDAERAALAGPGCEELLEFHEYFDGDDGRGLGASHQTGWTALVARLLEDLARDRPA